MFTRAVRLAQMNAQLGEGDRRSSDQRERRPREAVGAKIPDDGGRPRGDALGKLQHRDAIVRTEPVQCFGQHFGARTWPTLVQRLGQKPEA